MTKRVSRSILSVLLVVLLAVAALSGCANNAPASDTTAPSASLPLSGGDIGEGKTSFPFDVTDAEGKTVSFTVYTDASTVGEALLNAGLVSGEDGEYGLYVKSVNGTEADYDKDGAYWAFYVDGEYAMTSVDTTNIEEGHTYSFVYTKG